MVYLVTDTGESHHNSIFLMWGMEGAEHRTWKAGRKAEAESTRVPELATAEAGAGDLLGEEVPSFQVMDHRAGR